ncbi:cytochrome c oxidase assembly protein [Thauera linaloolentis]|uniref:Cytochrome c oxidase assembly protein CtaG n=1 Tax=Thauera linaloolentis (strain DSM 12138 / JCM 21573 / CCUG 41526 / CIP 105981 / IAM 15112 / NBRC 102519 / 47Lol) TaxID=1123367 RepID=N6YWC3_THAL4|nr:cytochrome c oxidase assembly protein [Thauera linaloolentis]ENO86403.1 cytochrome C oxidase assembly protein [Thauera linaloolentis 47Lol = DSM 12138]MCM8564216.1 cytochrome c oxidase assembly protein [Thauera linaloolentis]
MNSHAHRRLAADNRRLLLRLAVSAVAMFGFGFLLVPFYEKICEVTGINNFLRPEAERGARAVVNTQVDASRRILVQFDANLHDLPWRFRPLQRSLEVHPGQLVQVDYEVSNTREVPITGQAVPSYGPQLAGRYFNKMDCFCFEQQTLAPGERRIMPVVFVVDPALPEEVTVITLSYTFFELRGRNTTTAAQGRAAAAVERAASGKGAT